MQSFILAIALASVATASPAPFPQLPDFGAVEIAPVVVDGPPSGVSNQTDVYPSASAVAEAAAQVTAVSTNSTGVDKRSLFVLLDKLFGGHKVTQSKPKYPTQEKPTYPEKYPEQPVPVTTTVPQAPSTTSSSPNACSTMPEAGTYCKSSPI